MNSKLINWIDRKTRKLADILEEIRHQDPWCVWLVSGFIAGASLVACLNKLDSRDSRGLIARYVASDYTTNAGVATWPDRSGNHYDLTVDLRRERDAAVQAALVWQATAHLWESNYFRLKEKQKDRNRP